MEGCSNYYTHPPCSDFEFVSCVVHLLSCCLTCLSVCLSVCLYLSVFVCHFWLCSILFVVWVWRLPVLSRNSDMPRKLASIYDQRSHMEPSNQVHLLPNIWTHLEQPSWVIQTWLTMKGPTFIPSASPQRTSYSYRKCTVNEEVLLSTANGKRHPPGDPLYTMRLQMLDALRRGMCYRVGRLFLSHGHSSSTLYRYQFFVILFIGWQSCKLLHVFAVVDLSNPPRFVCIT